MVSCRPFTTSLVGASSSIENQHNHMRTASYHLLDCRIYSVKPNTGYSAGYHHAYCISYKKKFLGKNMALIHNFPLHLFVFHNILQQIIIFLTANEIHFIFGGKSCLSTDDIKCAKKFGKRIGFAQKPGKRGSVIGRI